MEFNSFTWHGDPLKVAIDGEWIARKGIGRVQIEPSPGIKVDVFVTHTAGIFCENRNRVVLLLAVKTSEFEKLKILFFSL